METISENLELQIDEKPNGCVIRINDAKGCRVRVCQIPRELVYNEQGELRDFIDITYPNFKIVTGKAKKHENKSS
jgi:uncharacterized FlaG/YvyC family protein